MLEVIICSVIGAVCMCGGGVFAYYKCVRPTEDEDKVYILDMSASDLNFTFNEIYTNRNKTISKVQI
jgi:hypothetical protein